MPSSSRKLEAILQYFPKPSFYPGQREAILEIYDAFLSGRRYVILEGPTGTGKSAIAMTLARLYGAFMATSQKTLQNQYAEDFPELAVVKGRNAYRCDVIDGFADVAPCVEFKKRTLSPCYLTSRGDYDDRREVSCPYAEALDAGANAHTTLFNYHSFFNHTTDMFPPRDLLVLDEAHNLESLALDIVQLPLEEKYLALDADMSLDALLEKLKRDGPYVTALRNEHSRLSAEVRVLKGREKTRAFREQTAVHKLIQKIYFMNSLREQTLDPDYKGLPFHEQWLMRVDKQLGASRPSKITLKPVFAGVFVPRMFLWRAARTLFMSATILSKDVFCSSIGVQPKHAAFVSIPCHFPVENRLVHVYPCGDLSFRAFDAGIGRVLDGVRRVLEIHKGQRGIIHTHSWKVLRALKAHIKDPRLIFQDESSRNREDCIDALKSSADGVLVAPAMSEGLDLKDDWSRFQIIVKVPWPDFSDPQIQARAKLDRRWAIWQAAIRVMQQSGRSVRSRTDYASTYVLDADFISFYNRSRVLVDSRGRRDSMLSPWYQEAIRVYDDDETQAFLDGRAVPVTV